MIFKDLFFGNIAWNNINKRIGSNLIDETIAKITNRFNKYIYMNTQSALNNKWMLSLRGLFLIGVSVVLFTVNKDASRNLVLVFALLTFVAGLSGVVFANSNRRII